METNMERNQDNGRGMFYAVIGVATLVVTIIGATFAYLTATTNSNVNAVTATGAKIALGYSDVQSGLKKNLIPIDTDLTQFAKGTYTNSAGTKYSFAGIGENDCRDVNGNNICSVYTFTIKNPTSTDGVSQYVYASFEVGINTFENLHFAVFKGTDTQIKGKSGYTLGEDDEAEEGYTTAISESEAKRKHAIADNGQLVVAKTKISQKTTAGGAVVKLPLNNQLDQYLDDGDEMTYTIILWVDETNSAQEDQDKSFTGTVRFTTEGNNTGVTGDLTADS